MNEKFFPELEQVPPPKIDGNGLDQIVIEENFDLFKLSPKEREIFNKYLDLVEDGEKERLAFLVANIIEAKNDKERSDLIQKLGEEMAK